ncbi:hypothetical protein [Streptococcus suis]|uniref:hypothetical protein n=2 Tax=Streptococcus suis TaxID=1307 RepID=UPI000CF5A8B7|nr:hypothetical protein [Streptococcus suis]HEL1604649.1 hypothetical protein [Streptococcus suis]HEL2324031.1 hypothetical protein [Streptococcus suis]
MKKTFKIHERKGALGFVDSFAELGSFYDFNQTYTVLRYTEQVQIVYLTVCDRYYNSIGTFNLWQSLDWGSGTLKDSPAIILLGLIESKVETRVFRKGTISLSHAIRFELSDCSSTSVFYDLYVDDSFVGNVSVTFLGLDSLSKLLGSGKISNELHSDYTALLLNSFSSVSERNEFYSEFMSRWGNVFKNKEVLIESR